MRLHKPAFMRSRLFHAVIGIAVSLSPTGCGGGEAPAVGPVDAQDDSAVTTEDVAVEPEDTDEAVDTGSADTGSADTHVKDTRVDAIDSGTDTRVDTAVDTAPDTTVDTATDTAKEAATDTAKEAATDTASEVATDAIITDAPTDADAETGWHPTK
jgi:hypothetical protein